MKLHYASDMPEWQNLTPAERNTWQRWAAQTSGIATPGNFFSVLGIVLVGLGLWAIADHSFGQGLWLLAIGRFCDIVDGTAADKSGTKSPLGEAVDAGFDKIAAFATLIVFAAYAIAPWWLLLLIALQNLTTASLSYTAHRLRKAFHPVAAGKIGSAVLWIGLLCFMLATALQNHTSTRHAWLFIAYALTLIGLGLCSYATMLYAQAFRSKKTA
jgi:cardiolipin synthase